MISKNSQKVNDIGIHMKKMAVISNTKKLSPRLSNSVLINYALMG